MAKIPAERAVVHVPFDDDTIEAVPESGRVLIPMRPLCERLGLDAASQRHRVARAAWATEVVTTSVGADGRTRELFCLDLDSLPMWLATISTRRVRPEVRPKLERYQREAARVLRDHFFGHADPAPAALPAPDVPDVRELALIAARGDLDALVRALPVPPGEPAAAALSLLEQASRLTAVAAKLRPRGVPVGPPPKLIGAGRTSSEDPALQTLAMREMINGRPELRELATQAFKTGGKRGLLDEDVDAIRACCVQQMLRTSLPSGEMTWLRLPSRSVMRAAIQDWRTFRPGPL